MLKTNSFISGIYLMMYFTDMPDGTLMGFDADFGDMYALNGKLVPEDTYRNSLKNKEKDFKVSDKLVIFT